jgi:hypothetical protein
MCVVLRARVNIGYSVPGVPLFVHTPVTLHLGGPLRQDKHTEYKPFQGLQDISCISPWSNLSHEELRSHIYTIRNSVSDLQHAQTKRYLEVNIL